MDSGAVGGEASVGVAAAARAALSARDGGPPVVVVARCDAAADGRRMLVTPDGHRGTLGDPALDAAAAALGKELLEPGAPDALRRELTESGAALYAECHRRPARVVVVGAGHIALPLVRLAVQLGFTVQVLDDRDEFAQEVRFPDASDVRRVDFTDPFATDPPGADDFVVLVTRAHRYDFDCLHRLLRSPAPPRYIGMVGSRRRIRAAYRALLDAGIPRASLSSIHAPVGVDIGAETPEEIAVSIAAELVAVRRGVTPGGSLRDRERIVERYLDDDDALDEDAPAGSGGTA